MTAWIPTLPRLGTPASVVGVLLNHRSAWAQWQPAMNSDPYKAPPKRPVLYLKPANTWASTGAALVLPEGASEIVIGACLGVVIGRTAQRLTPEEALDCVAGYTLVIDAHLPHESIYRPPLKFNARDGYCPMGPQVVPMAPLDAVAQLDLETWVDGARAATLRVGDWVRPLPQLITDITEFMTLSAGDVLLCGTAADAARAKAGQQVRVCATGLGELHAHVVSGELA